MERKSNKTVWRKSGACEFTDPKGKALPEPAIDYKKIHYKTYPDKTIIGVNKMDGNKLPPESKVPPSKKYDANGKYIKHQYFAEKKVEKKIPKYSLGEVVRDALLSNPKYRNLNGK